MKQLTKIGIRVWFTLSCLLTFGMGWVALSRSDVQVVEAPTSNVETLSEINLPPVPSVDDLAGNNQPSNSNSQFVVSMPVLRTKGS